ncbi:hypothetical protein [Streptomyces sp. DASNCL29]|uniref:hypothetical protein n=1 Tax=Streptomyces sp. DASNCL29 TaxID=2583819 RepID=UPI0019D107DC|nr:hypothetical protein [Streptomyces sp. DASNCL29]
MALEVLGQQRAKLLGDPLTVTVDGVVTMDLQENLCAASSGGWEPYARASTS